MKVRQLGVLVAVLLVLGACRDHEKSITGSYGNSVVTGQVTMAAGMSNGSPAGVEISVGGTGMTAVLGADGRFTFAGVPDGAVLHLRRASDGIEATTNAVAGFNAIELSKTAVTSSKRRSTSPSPTIQIEGLIKSAAADSIVVTTEDKGDFTVAITADTVIRKGQTVVAATDLKQGDRVHVQATFKDSKYTAVQVIVQNQGQGDDGDNTQQPLVQIEGTLAKVAADSIDVTMQSKTFTVALTPNTVIRKGHTTVAPADLKVGDRVHVQATVSNSVYTAVQVILQNDGQNETQIEGTLAKVAADSIDVTTESSTVTVALTTSTIIRKGQTTLAPADLKVGDQVHVKATFSNNVYTATEVIVQDQGDDSNPDNGGQTATANGIVSSLGANSMVVHRQMGADVTVQVDSSTIIRKYGTKIAFTDIKSGNQVECLGTRVDAQTIKATQIEVQDAPGTHGGGH